MRLRLYGVDMFCTNIARNNSEVTENLPFLRYTFLTILFCFIFAPAAFTQNRVLELDGRDDYVELPSNIFNNLDEATIECWVKWKRFGYFSQPFGFGSGKKWQVMAINNGVNNRDLQFFIYVRGRLHIIKISDILRLDQWYHLAAVSGKGGMKLYINGILVGQEQYKGSFMSIENVENNYFGKANWPEYNDYFEGQLDEIRIWKFARTESQIKTLMYKKLVGNETGLAGFWPFDNNNAEDLSGNGHHGALMNGAYCVMSELPSPDDVNHPALLSGTATDDMGNGISGASIRLWQNGEIISDATTNNKGRYRIIVSPNESSYDISATCRQNGTWYSGLHLRQTEHRILNLVLQQAVSISGVIQAWDSEPHAAASVQVVRINESTGQEQVVATKLSDEFGKYQFINLKSGHYLVRCYVIEGCIYYHKRKIGRCLATVSGRENAEILQVETGKELRNINFRYAPLKKGVWRNLTYLDGLASNQINAIHRDTDGSMLFATSNGISHYDGKEFTNSCEICSRMTEEVLAIHSNGDGVFWFGTKNGVYCYDGEFFSNFTTEHGLADNHVLAIDKDTNGTLWFGTKGGGVSRYDGKAFATFTSGDGLTSNIIYDIYCASDGIVWFATIGGISYYNGREFVNLAEEIGVILREVKNIYQDSNGVLWFGSYWDGIYRYDGEALTNLSTKDGLAGNSIFEIYQDRDGIMWFATENYGVSRYDGEGFVTYTIHDGLVHNNIAAIAEDENGILYFGAAENGISRYDNKGFLTYTTKDGLISNNVVSVEPDGTGGFWSGTRGGISHYDGKKFTYINQGDKLAGHHINTIHRSSDGILWLGNYGKGVLRYNGETLEALEYSDAMGFASSITSSNDGVLWIGTQSRGIIRLDGYIEPELAGSDSRSSRMFAQQDGLETPYIQKIHTDQNGMLWCGTFQHGVTRYDGNQFVNFTSEHGLAGNDIKAIYSGLGDMLWFGTNNGVSRYDGNRFINLTKEDGLKDNHVLAIHEHSDGILWFGTRSGGVSAYDGTAWTSLDTHDGLASNTVYAIHEDEEGFLWFATDDGITRYQRTSSVPSVRIVSVQSDKRYTDLAAIPPITAGSRATIEYQAIDFKTFPEKQQYQCRIGKKGKEQSENQILIGNWEEATKGTKYEWMSGKPGKYIFEVQAIDRDLNYSAPAAIALTVVPPWYLNGWIAAPLGGTFLSLLLLSIGLSFRYHAQRQKSAQLREQMEEERQKIEKLESIGTLAGGIAHDLNNFLTAIVGNISLAMVFEDPQKKDRLLTEADKACTQVSNLTKQLLTFSKGGAPILQAAIIGDLLKDSAAFALRGSNVECELIIPDDLWPAEIDVGQINQVINNLAINARQAMPDGGTIAIQAENVTMDTESSLPIEAGGYIKISLKDQGTGISQENLQKIFDPFFTTKQAGSGLGLATSYSIIEKHKGYISVESQIDIGTTFYIYLPASLGEIPMQDEKVEKKPTIGTGKILVMDDEKHVRDTTASVLTSMGYEVTTTINGAEAIKTYKEEMASDNPFDAIILDLTIPGGMGGKEAIKELIEIDPGVKAVVSSGYSGDPILSNFREYGFMDLIPKPYKIQELNEILHRVITVNS